jgi:hypothetical protein
MRAYAPAPQIYEVQAYERCMPEVQAYERHAPLICLHLCSHEVEGRARVEVEGRARVEVHASRGACLSLGACLSHMRVEVHAYERYLLLIYALYRRSRSIYI